MIRWIANVTVVIGFLVSLPLWFRYDTANPDFQFVERLPWIPSIGAEYFLGVDGFSVLLILLTTLMGVIAVLSSWTAITMRVKEYYIFLLMLQTGMLGAFVSLDFLLFFLFWEVMLVPMYFLIGIWGSDNRLYSAIKFFLFTLVGSVVMLLGILAVYFYNHSVTGVYTFDVTQFHQLSIPADMQWWIFLAFFLGFAVKVPMFPFHTWLPDAHTDAPTAGSVILAAVLLKMGTYGFHPLQPADPAGGDRRVRAPRGGAVDHRHRLRRAGGDGATGLEASRRLLQRQPHGHGDAGHVRPDAGGHHRQHRAAAQPRHLDRRALPHRRHRVRATAYAAYRRVRRLSKVMPVYAAVFLVMTMSSIGLPTLNGFIGEILILQGVFVVQKTWGVLRGVRHRARRRLHALALPAHHVRYRDEPEEREPAGSQHAEFVTFAPLLVLAVWIGLYPKPSWIGWRPPWTGS